MGRMDSCKDEMACVYSALLLADDNLEINDDNIKKVMDAANIQYESFWPKLFCSGIAGLNIQDLISSAMSAPAAVSAAPVAQTSAKQEAPAKEEKKPEPE